MRRSRVVRVVRLVPFVIVGIAVFGLIVMALWNSLMPPIFGLKTVGYWQAMGLVILCRILFGGFHGHSGSHRGRRMMERWEQMTPEERQKFREGLRSGRGRVEPSEPNPLS